MSNEVAFDYTSGSTLYFCRFRPDGQVFISDGSAAETWGTSGHDADNYDVTLTEAGSSGHYVGHFDTPGNIANGTYRVTIYVQSGENPADADVAIAHGIIFWKGSTINLGTINSVCDAIKERTDNLPDDPADDSDIDDTLAEILAAQRTVKNVIDESSEGAGGTGSATGVYPERCR